MAKKLQVIGELSDKTIKSFSDTPINWTQFLKTSSWNYKYPFHEQLLIYAQRPDATACAEMETWNNHKDLRRFVNRGAKGIALIREKQGEIYLAHVFDISDTNSFYGNEVRLWKNDERYAEDIAETLKNTFGDDSEQLGLINTVLSVSDIAAADNSVDYLRDLANVADNSLLSDYDQLNLGIKFKELLQNSVAYTILNRLGYNAEDYFEPEDFQEITEFNTPETILILGIATSDISEMALRSIETTVRAKQREEIADRKKFANSQKMLDNKNINNTERDGNYGNDVQERGRISDTRLGSAGNTADRQIRNVTQDIHQTEQKTDVFHVDDEGRVDRVSDGNRPKGEDTSGTDHSGDDKNNRDARQSNRPNGVGGDDEQSESGGGGNRDGGADLQLMPQEPKPLANGDWLAKGVPAVQLSLFPTVAQQQNIIEEAEQKDKGSAFSMPVSQEDIDSVLQGGSMIEHGKYRIYLHFQELHTQKETVDFLKNEYGWGGSTFFFPDGTRGYQNHDGKGITIEKTNPHRQKPDIVLSWDKVAKRLKELISVDRYLNNKEKEYLPIYQQDMEEKKLQAAEEQKLREILSQAPPESKDYSYHLGDTVYIGSNEYQILAFDDNVVRLYDNDFPLFNKEMPREEFDRKIKENPSNDHLIVVAGEDIEISSMTDEEKQGFIDGVEIAQDYGDGNVLNQNEIDVYEVLVNEQSEQSDEIPIGTKITIDNRKYIVESISEFSGDVSLRDITFQEGVGFPINRLESKEFVLQFLDKEKEKPIIPSWEKPKKGRINTYDIHPEIPNSERHNFKITDNNLGVGGAKEKFRNNVEAINTLKNIESENRFATPKEQEILSKYVGWGGLPEAFDEGKPQWANEYSQLKTLLAPDEYEQARASTLNAHYTCPIVIKAVYQAIENMGRRAAAGNTRLPAWNILEPSCGTGNFMGLIPDSMQDSKIYGIELDSITGRIAQQLYQKTSVAVQGYEDTALPDSFFDVAIGNVPFGNYKILEKKYDKNNFLIHDFFFAKTLDKVRPGGVVAFITSSGTMDKKNPAIRKYIAQRADLLGAIRLPNNAFLANAGTQVTADILFLQKRDRMTDIMPEWVHLATDENNFTMNSYFVENREMILGEMTEEHTQYGTDDLTCKPYPDANLEELLQGAISNIHAEISEYELDELDEEDLSIPADPNVRNFSYAIVDGDIYFRENSRMNKVDLSATAASRVKGMIEIRECVRALIEYQTEDYSDSVIKDEQTKLNALYDKFTKKYGLINSRANSTAFSDDSAYCLLCSLEIIDENGELTRKADMFTKRTIKQHTKILSVDTAVEALAVSLGEKARIDLSFMQGLVNIPMDKMLSDLQGIIFEIPKQGEPAADRPPEWVTADEYLSGNVREKLDIAKMYAENHSEFSPNVTALEAVQPKDLTAAEISVRLGATWIPPEIIRQFTFEFLDTPYFSKQEIKVHYSNLTAEWNIEGKSRDRGNIKAYSTYGTSRINAYKIIEESLNLRDVRIFDYVENENGNKVPVLNKKETAIAQQKQQIIKDEFGEWIWKDPDRREKLTRIYNDKFNSIRPREYDGSHLTFNGINPEITLRPHQTNAIARTIYGGNTLLAHVVGAGKTFEMVAAAMESKRLGLCNKSMFVVPNHLIEQWAAEFLQLYPSANILISTKKDFETKNRKKFCGRIATGDYDAVIIGHSQFERIPMSVERQAQLLEQQINDVTGGIRELKNNHSENFSVKQLEKTKKMLEAKLKKLNDQSRKDNVVTFEELGIDRLFIDEAHGFKNLFLYTKMRNVGGIAQTEAQKSSDLFMKCRYLDEITGGKGVIFATGTPISNSMVELYTIQRYLQYSSLQRNGLTHFDAWASTFGETVTAIELAPEGTNYRAKTRFAKFYNLPELMAMFKEVADIQTADMLNLPVPKANYKVIAVEPTELQKEMVAELSNRADAVRDKKVEPTEDNMLLITNDGRKLALDQRLMNEMLPDDENSKIAHCANEVFETWDKYKADRLTQLVFCDLSTPHYDGKFNIYDDLKNKLIAKGVPENEVMFIHDADTDIKKKELFAKVRKGQVRVLIGSTAKMGAGTNVQKKLIALHDVDCPWRPSDLEQRGGRIIRQGNDNPEVFLNRYVTKDTFDAYLYQLVENKQKFISQIMTSKSPVRVAEDVDEMALSYAEIKALATGNPHIKEKMDLDVEVSKLKLLKGNYLSQKYELEDMIIKKYPTEIKLSETRIAGYTADIELAKKHPKSADHFPPMMIDEVTYTDKELAGKALIERCKLMTSPEVVSIGTYRGFQMAMSFDTFSKEYKIMLHNTLSYTVALGTDTFGNITRLDNALDGLEDKLKVAEQTLANTKNQFETAKVEVEKPFIKEDDLKEKSARLDELNILLNMDKKEPEIIDSDISEVETDEKPERQSVKKEYEMVR